VACETVDVKKNAAGGVAAGGTAVVDDGAAAKDGAILTPTDLGAATTALLIAKVVGVNDENVGSDDAQKGTCLLGNLPKIAKSKTLTSL